jgi:hypothetical protein
MSPTDSVLVQETENAAKNQQRAAFIYTITVILTVILLLYLLFLYGIGSFICHIYVGVFIYVGVLCYLH